METDIVLCVLIGIPGAGKSTLSNLLKTKFSVTNFKVLSLSFDNFSSVNDQAKMVSKIKTQSDITVFKDARLHFMETIESIVHSIKVKRILDQSLICYFDGDISFSNGIKYLVLLDDNFYYRSMRYKIYQLAAKYECGFCQIYLKCNLKTAIERNRNRLQDVPNVAIETMYERIEPPDADCNRWETESLTLLSDLLNHSFDLDVIKAFAFKNFSKIAVISNPEGDNLREKLETRMINKKNILHQSDLILRSLVSDKIKSLQKDDRRSVMNKCLANIKQDLLQKIRGLELEFPASIFQEGNLNLDALREFLTHEFNNAYMHLCC